MNAISFSLHGSDPKYCVGMLKNMSLASEHYPGWKVFVCTDKTVPPEIIEKLKSLGAEIVTAVDSRVAGYFWRFCVNDVPGVERFIVRDADSRIGPREVAAVNAWIESGKGFHIMRDHPHHTTAIVGGVWGAKRGAIRDMTGLIARWSGHKQGYDSDQEFLRKVIWPMVRADSLQHDTCCRNLYPEAIPFPTRLAYDNPRFCCEVFDENDIPRAYDWEKMLNFIPNQ